MSARTLIGLDVLGAAPDRGLLIKINNIDDLVRAQGGATGAPAIRLAYSVLECPSLAAE